GSAGYHVSKVLVVHHFGNSLSDRLSFHTNDSCADILGALDIGLPGLLIASVFVLAAIDIDHVQLPIQRLRHPGAARNQMLSGGIGTNADADALAHPEIPAALLVVSR